ncbi:MULTISPECIES: AarF/UbiB family protein [unclassified Streptomyces]|uniref:ABC1 kinase family protein n=1 Tax=unclassified Streptomyces TaxID=2593676 RepID=UPI001CC08931|nr:MULTISPECIES: AarF/UbiB family protein [unclassified Streptomyces]WPO70462.1 AarF/UbiB family protein [Streptomyces sp. KN37]
MSSGRLRLLTRVVGDLLKREVSERRASADGQEVVQRRAVAVREAFERLGPLYMKVGQILSTRPDIVPPAIAKELEKLHDRADVLPFSVMEPVLAADLGPAWRSHFAYLNVASPLGAASLAQVYGGRLHNGENVVVKVQRPGIQSVMNADMRLLRRASRHVARCTPRFNATVDLPAMLAVVFDAIRPELDFRSEARNMDTARRHVHEFESLTVPEVLHATERVMVQSLAPGVNIRDADRADFKDGDREAIGRDLLGFMLRGYFENRFFHADPHPGNILVDPEYGAAVIDWGSVGKIDRRTSMHLMLVLLGVSQNDGQSAARAWAAMGKATPWADLPGFHSDISLLTPHVFTATMEELNFGTLFATVLQHSTKRGIATSPLVSVLGKSFANIDGAVRYFTPEISVIDVFIEVLDRIVHSLVKESVSEVQLTRTLLEGLSAASAAPGQLQDIVRDLANRDVTYRTFTHYGEAGVSGRRTRQLTPLAIIYLLWRTRRTR